MNRYDHVPIKLYLPNLVAHQIWPMGHSLPTPILDHSLNFLIAWQCGKVRVTAEPGLRQEWTVQPERCWWPETTPISIIFQAASLLASRKFLICSNLVLVVRKLGWWVYLWKTEKWPWPWELQSKLFFSCKPIFPEKWGSDCRKVRFLPSVPWGTSVMQVCLHLPIKHLEETVHETMWRSTTWSCILPLSVLRLSNTAAHTQCRG